LLENTGIFEQHQLLLIIIIIIIIICDQGNFKRFQLHPDQFADAPVCFDTVLKANNSRKKSLPVEKAVDRYYLFVAVKKLSKKDSN